MASDLKVYSDPKATLGVPPRDRPQGEASVNLQGGGILVHRPREGRESDRESPASIESQERGYSQGANHGVSNSDQRVAHNNISGVSAANHTQETGPDKG